MTGIPPGLDFGVSPSRLVVDDREDKELVRWQWGPLKAPSAQEVEESGIPQLLGELEGLPSVIGVGVNNASNSKNKEQELQSSSENHSPEPILFTVGARSPNRVGAVRHITKS